MFHVKRTNQILTLVGEDIPKGPLRGRSDLEIKNRAGGKTIKPPAQDVAMPSFKYDSLQRYQYVYLRISVNNYQ